MLVVDASLVVSALIGTGSDGTWASSLLPAGPICAPHLMPVEVASVLRRAATAGDLSADAASLAFADLLDLRVELYPFAPVAVRVWEMHANVQSYDAWYVALAELLGAPVATLDRRLPVRRGCAASFGRRPKCLRRARSTAGT
jgi:predicted nucleic acid-binding protein